MGKPLYPNLQAQMAKYGETGETLAKLLGISSISVYNKLSGKTEWKISEIETLCKRFDSDYYHLFKKGE